MILVNIQTKYLVNLKQDHFSFKNLIWLRNKKNSFDVYKKIILNFYMKFTSVVNIFITHFKLQF
jgi:hypothetical protein